LRELILELPHILVAQSLLLLAVFELLLHILDCLLQFINDQFDEPAFEKFSLGLKASKSRNRGVYSWVDTTSDVQDFDADTPKFTNWFSGVPASGQQCTFFAVGTSIVNGLWYGADCDETPMFGICEIEPL